MKKDLKITVRRESGRTILVIEGPVPVSELGALIAFAKSYGCTHLGTGPGCNFTITPKVIDEKLENEGGKL